MLHPRQSARPPLSTFNAHLRAVIFILFRQTSCYDVVNHSFSPPIPSLALSTLTSPEPRLSPGPDPGFNTRHPHLPHLDLLMIRPRGQRESGRYNMRVSTPSLIFLTPQQGATHHQELSLVPVCSNYLTACYLSR